MLLYLIRFKDSVSTLILYQEPDIGVNHPWVWIMAPDQGKKFKELECMPSKFDSYCNTTFQALVCVTLMDPSSTEAQQHQVTRSETELSGSHSQVLLEVACSLSTA